MSSLEVDDLVVSYGDNEVVHGVCLAVEPGEVVAVLGANGAGKSSTLLGISGVARRLGGTVRLDGRDLTHLPGHFVARAGIGHVPEGRRVFPEMTVRENLQVGARGVRSSAELRRRFDSAYELFPRLFERQRQRAGSLSGGEQQMVAIGRAIMGAPKALMLDEPSLGLSPAMVDLTFETIVKFRTWGVGVLVVEQNAGEALDISDRAYVMESGVITISGTAAELRANPKVRAAYLGI